MQHICSQHEYQWTIVLFGFASSEDCAYRLRPSLNIWLGLMPEGVRPFKTSSLSHSHLKAFSRFPLSSDSSSKLLSAPAKLHELLGVLSLSTMCLQVALHADLLGEVHPAFAVDISDTVERHGVQAPGSIPVSYLPFQSLLVLKSLPPMSSNHLSATRNLVFEQCCQTLRVPLASIASASP